MACSGVVVATMEVVVFRLIDGSNEDDFLEKARNTEPVVRSCPGFLSRRLFRSADGTWTDIVEWASLADAKKAAEVVVHNAAFAPFMSLIDPASVQFRHDSLMFRM